MSLWDSVCTCERTPLRCISASELAHILATQPALSPCHGEGQGNSHFYLMGTLLPLRFTAPIERPHTLVRPIRTLAPPFKLGPHCPVPPSMRAKVHSTMKLYYFL